jgi:hypothetical protein
MEANTKTLRTELGCFFGLYSEKVPIVLDYGTWSSVSIKGENMSAR